MTQQLYYSSSFIACLSRFWFFSNTFSDAESNNHIAYNDSPSNNDSFSTNDYISNNSRTSTR